MRYSELVESIANRPLNLKLFLTNRIKEADALLRDFEQASLLIIKNDDGEMLLRSFLNYVTEDRELTADAGNLAYTARKSQYNDDFGFARYLPLKRVRDSLENYLKFGPEFLHYIMNTFKDVEEFPARYLAVFDILDDANKGAAEYGYVEGDPANDDDEDYLNAIGLLAGLRLFRDAFKKATKLLQSVKSKLEVIVSLRSHYGGLEKWRPEHGEVETLYHASTHCPEILRDGFLKEKPDDRRGLGNFGGDQNGISFTHEVEIARNIMRYLKEIWMIAHGQLTSKQLLQWADAEKIDKKQIYSHIGKPLTAHMSIDDTVKLHRCIISLSKIRTDPVITNPELTLENMKRRSLSDIGVLACECRLTGQDEYLYGESEFRLAADRVISVKRLF